VPSNLFTRQQIRSILRSTLHASEGALRVMADRLPESDAERLDVYRKGYWDALCAIGMACELDEPGPEPMIEDGRTLSERFSPGRFVEGQAVEAGSW
jgi:hypothetical protein